MIYGPQNIPHLNIMIYVLKKNSYFISGHLFFLLSYIFFLMHKIQKGVHAPSCISESTFLGAVREMMLCAATQWARQAENMKEPIKIRGFCTP